MKNILSSIYEIFESIGKAKTAAHLTRCGMHAEAKALMMEKSL
jgi:hypothetical protein